MGHLVISSIGTSLITNVMPPPERGRFFELSNNRERELSAGDKAWLDEAIAAASAELEAAALDRVKVLSAELNGVLRLMSEISNAPRRSIHHLLIATDTYAGAATGAMVRDWLLGFGHSVDLRIPRELRTKDLMEFRSALADLVPELLHVIGENKSRRYEVVFNLTGGFKGVPGFLQSIANVTGCESIYVFEGAETLLRIPRLPIRLDGTAAVGDQFALFRRLDADEPVTEEEVRVAGIAETLLLLVDGQARLSEWGRVVYADAWSNLASHGLLEPRTRRITYSARFRSEASKLTEAWQQLAVNSAVEAFQRRLEGKADGRLESHKFKALNGYPAGPATHELYAWSGHGPGLLFLYERDGVWVADRLGPHL